MTNVVEYCVSAASFSFSTTVHGFRLALAFRIENFKNVGPFVAGLSFMQEKAVSPVLVVRYTKKEARYVHGNAFV